MEMLNVMMGAKAFLEKMQADVKSAQDDDDLKPLLTIETMVERDESASTLASMNALSEDLADWQPEAAGAMTMTDVREAIETQESEEVDEEVASSELTDVTSEMEG